jgi:hypothetical protein
VNILFLSPATRMDYQCDALFIGFRQLYGPTVIDCPRIPHLYQDYSGDQSQLYGRGFTLTRILPEVPIDRSNIKERIASREFDLIIYGSIQRDQSFFDLVVSRYPRDRIILIDGEDQSHLLYNLSRHGLYFKRELPQPMDRVYPIHFAIPKEKISTLRHLSKIRVRARSDPRDRSTYIFQTEQDYYTDYAQSLFAFTMRKGGWDCMRHYEIMANGCIPLFLDLDQCPPTTMMQLPKPELLEALTYMDCDGDFWDTSDGKSIWTSLHRRIHLKFVCHSTTERLAQYVIETQQRESHEASH